MANVAAAFFDLDKTLIERTSGVAFASCFRKAGLLSSKALTKLAWEHAKFMRRSGPEESMRLAKVGLELAKGQSQSATRRLVSENLLDVISPLTFPRGVELMDHHRSVGDLIVIVSSSPADVVLPIARLYGVDLAIASIPTVDPNGKYTGELEFFAYGEHKVPAMRSVASARAVDLARSTAYSDSITDLPMLKEVGNPVVVNPDKDLAVEASRNGWRIEHFSGPGFDWSERASASTDHETELVTGGG
jgi:HAD superfamily hydrolase (TIGR01490 family)